MVNCIKINCKNYNTESCNNCKEKRSYVQEELKKIDEKLERNK